MYEIKVNCSSLAELIIPSIFVKKNSVIFGSIAGECKIMFPKKKAVNIECLYCTIVITMSKVHITGMTLLNC